VRVHEPDAAKSRERKTRVSYRNSRGVLHARVKFNLHARRISTDDVHVMTATGQAVCNATHVAFDPGKAIAAHDMYDFMVMTTTIFH
jgi:hypothetical protein